MIHLNKPAPKYLSAIQQQQLYDLLYKNQNGLCHKCGSIISVEYIPPHHALIHNNDSNRKQYPLLVHHPVNQVIICFACHQDYPYYMQLAYNVIKDVNEYIIKHQEDAIDQIKKAIYKKWRDYINWCED